MSLWVIEQKRISNRGPCHGFKIFGFAKKQTTAKITPTFKLEVLETFGKLRKLSLKIEVFEQNLMIWLNE